MRLKPGVGDKALLREVLHFLFAERMTNSKIQAGRRLGLGPSTLLVKRAIQFGSRIAKVSQAEADGEGKKRKIKRADGVNLQPRLAKSPINPSSET